MKNKSFEKLFFSKTREFLDEYLLSQCSSVKIAVLAHTARSTRAILPKQESHLAGWLN